MRQVKQRDDMKTTPTKLVCFQAETSYITTAYIYIATVLIANLVPVITIPVQLMLRLESKQKEKVKCLRDKSKFTKDLLRHDAHDTFQIDYVD